MLKSILARIATILLFSILIGCGGGGGGIPNPRLSNVVVDMGRAKAAIITPDGGQITTADSHGFIYTLTIPSGAVAQDTRIFMYPVTSMKNLPAGGVVTAGVYLAPEGLQFLVPATLATQVPGGTDPKQLPAYEYSGDGAQLHGDISFINGQTITEKVYHFSGKVLGNRTLVSLVGSITGDPVGQMHQDMLNAQIQSSVTGASPASDYLTILRTFYHNTVEQVLITGGRPGANVQEVLDAEHDYDAWLDAILFAQLTIPDSTFNIVPENADSEPLAIAVLQRHYQLGNKMCTDNKTGSLSAGLGSPLFDARFALLAGEIARKWNIPQQPNGLDDQTLINNLCAKVVIESRQFTTNISPGGSGTLNVKAGVSFAGDPPRHDVPLKVSLTRSGNPTGTPSSGRPDQQGDFNSNVAWPQGVDPLTILITANIDSGSLTPVQTTDTITKSQNAQVASIRINPIGGVSVGINATATLSAQALDSSGNVVAVDPARWQWGIGPANIASIAANGASATVTGNAVGAAAATLSLAGTSLTATAGVNVTGQCVANGLVNMQGPHFIGSCNSAIVSAFPQGVTNTDVTFSVAGGHVRVGTTLQISGGMRAIVVSDGGTGSPAAVTVTATSVENNQIVGCLIMQVDPLVSAYSGSNDSVFVARGADAGVPDDQYQVSVNLPGPPLNESFTGPIVGGNFSATNPQTGDSISATGIGGTIQGSVVTRFATFNFKVDKACAPP